MIFPRIKHTIENITLSEGIPLSHACGVDPDSASLKFTPNRFGLSADLNLRAFNWQQCISDFKKALPNVKDTLFK
jgi:hypothetical protein